MENTSQVPVTVLTGFLGAGKTTLLNRILTEQHGRKYAVIVNEFGEQGIDNDLVVDADEEVFEMNNGCICCTVRGDLIRILSGLMKRADKLDAIIVETTGLADPAPVAQTFFVDQDVADRTKLDAIVTVADAVHLSSQLTEHHEAEEQIAFADVVLLNKVDLVDNKTLLPLIKDFEAICSFDATFIISALTGEGSKEVLSYLAKNLPKGPWLYPEDEITDLPARLLAAEITREQIFMRLHQELPYATTVETEEWTERDDGAIVINQIIYLKKEIFLMVK